MAYTVRVELFGSQMNLFENGVRKMKKSLLLVMALGGVSAAYAQPAIYTELGSIFDVSSDYSMADRSVRIGSFAAAEVKWFRFRLEQATSASAIFLDVDTSTVGQADATTHLVDTEIGIYDNTGLFLDTDDDDGHGFYSNLTYGQTAPTRSYTIGGGIGTMTAANGRDGDLAAGIYWVAVGQFNTVYGGTNWSVTSSGAGDADDTQLNFRTNAVPEPGTIAALGLGAIVLLRRKRK